MMTLMECARKICYLLGLDENTITEIYFVERKAPNKNLLIKGAVLHTYCTIIIVPDLNNMEYILQYDNQSDEEISRNLVDVHQFSQRDISKILRYSQSAISRKINKKGVKENEKGGIDQKDQDLH